MQEWGKSGNVSCEGVKKLHKLKEKELASYCQYLENIIEHAPDGIYITDGDANAIMINKAFERISGLKRENLIGKNHKVLEKEGIIRKSCALEVLRRKCEITIIHEYLQTGKTALDTCTPIFDKNGEIILTISSIRDLTELNLLEKKYNDELHLRQKYEKQLELLSDKLSKSEALIAKDEHMEHVLMLANRMSRVDSVVMLTGETGVGKDVIANYIHKMSHRADKPMVSINCGALPESLIESELFGYEANAFTGAKKGGKSGVFEAANGGTLFLDEVGELPLNIQVKLLRCIQNKKITRVGGTDEISIDVRIISATNRDLKKMVDQGLFREDLYYRLSVVPIAIPPLRERIEDIKPLADYFLKEYNQYYGYHKKFSDGAYQALCAYNWPGNVRELRNLIERIMVINEEEILTEKMMPFANYMDNERMRKRFSEGTLKERVEKFELEMINEAYERCHNVRAAAKDLGMSEPTYVRKRKCYMEKYNK